MNKEYRKDETKPSDMFVNSIGFGVGSDHMECGWCSRLHLCPDTTFDPPDYEDTTSDEEDRARWREYCEEEHRKDSEGVILHYGYDCISGKEMNGLVFVVDCPCNGLSRFEKFIWNERNTIRNYLKVRIEQEEQWAREELVLNKLAGI